MVKYCEDLSCRHAVLSWYFGDSRPACAPSCDVCLDRQNVKDKLEVFHSSEFGGGGEGGNNYEKYREGNKELYSAIQENFYLKN